MKITTVQYFCDRCHEEISDISQTEEALTMYSAFGPFGQRISHARVTIQYADRVTVEYKTSMLCDKCKIEALEEVLKNLKERSERNG